MDLLIISRNECKEQDSLLFKFLKEVLYFKLKSNTVDRLLRVKLVSVSNRRDNNEDSLLQSMICNWLSRDSLWVPWSDHLNNKMSCLLPDQRGFRAEKTTGPPLNSVNIRPIGAPVGAIRRRRRPDVIRTSTRRALFPSSIFTSLMVSYETIKIKKALNELTQMVLRLHVANSFEWSQDWCQDWCPSEALDNKLFQ